VAEHNSSLDKKSVSLRDDVKPCCLANQITRSSDLLRRALMCAEPGNSQRFAVRSCPRLLVPEGVSRRCNEELSLAIGCKRETGLDVFARESEKSPRISSSLIPPARTPELSWTVMRRPRIPRLAAALAGLDCNDLGVVHIESLVIGALNRHDEPSPELTIRLARHPPEWPESATSSASASSK